MSRIGDAMKRAGTEASAAAGFTELEPTEAITESDEPEPEPEPPSPSATASDSVPVSEVTISPMRSDRPDAPTETGLYPPFADSVTEQLMVHPDAPPIAREQYRRLAATLHHIQGERGLRTLIVASALAGEGKTLTSVNIALTLSESYRRRVLLIDADLRRPSVHAALGFENVVGLTDTLTAKQERRVPMVEISPRLSVLPAGRPNPDPMEILTSSRMLKILDEASAVFDWVIIDTPPVALLPDANLLAAMVDGALLIVSANQTPVAIINKAIDAIGRDRILGVVLNRAEKDAMVHGDYYYRYYGYTEKKSRLRLPIS
jgi:protein-tyrosine kinase